MTASQTTLRAAGWSIASTDPQVFTFERFVGGRLIGTATVRGAKTTAEAWRALRELIDAGDKFLAVPSRPRASA